MNDLAAIHMASSENYGGHSFGQRLKARSTSPTASRASVGESDACNWNYFWYHLGYTADKINARDNEKMASYWQSKVRISFVLAMVSFLAASLVLATAMANLK
jgi:hypothetical protein